MDKTDRGARGRGGIGAAVDEDGALTRLDEAELDVSELLADPFRAAAANLEVKATCYLA